MSKSRPQNTSGQVDEAAIKSKKYQIFFKPQERRLYSIWISDI